MKELTRIFNLMSSEKKLHLLLGKIEFSCFHSHTMFEYSCLNIDNPRVSELNSSSLC